jgi:hypothetical protein
MKAINMLFSTVIFFSMNIISLAQSYNTLAEVISSGGGKTDGGSYSNFGVIGESFVNEFMTGGIYNGSSAGFVFSTDITVGLKETTKSIDVIIYPVPSKDKLFIETKSKNISIDRLELVDNIGNRLYQKDYPLFTNVIEIEVSSYSPGMYFLRFYIDDMVLTRKVIIQH